LSSLRGCDASHTGIVVCELQCLVMVEVLTLGATLPSRRETMASAGGVVGARVAGGEWREQLFG
jgi:hypothetical protein